MSGARLRVPMRPRECAHDLAPLRRPHGRCRGESPTTIPSLLGPRTFGDEGVVGASDCVVRELR